MAISPNDATAAALRAEMARLRVNGKQLAGRLGRSEMWVSRRAGGVTPLTVADVHEIAAALEIEPGVLLGASTATP